MNQPNAVPDGIENHEFDAIVIGAGINGAGIVRDAAMRGLDMLLVEKHDISSGTTPWSTRLIHGGLRYLEHGEVGLVRESLRERATLMRIAPHLVQSLEFVVPVYDWHRRGMTTIRAGMLAYDLLSAGTHLPRHRVLSADEALVCAPGLQRDGLRGAAQYRDGQVTFPERLTVENVVDAKAYGATIVTHGSVTEIVTRHGTVEGVKVRMERSGESFRARSGIVVNAAGPWLDALLKDGTSQPLIGGTKGSHIVVRRFPGAPSAAVYSEAREDRRPFFVVPWREWLLIGTTDTPFSGNPDGVRATHDEVDYLLRQTLAIFPDSRLTHDGVLFTYAGVRPLPKVAGRLSGAVTRRHFVRHHAPHADGLYSVVGGKLTTYRRLAKEITDTICRRVGHGDRCRTADAMLPGTGETDDAEQRLHHANVPLPAIRRLRSIYGARMAGLASLIEHSPALGGPIGSDRTTVAAEIVFAVQSEMARTIGDVLLRRTMLGLRPGLGCDLLDPALTIASVHLGWSDALIANERQIYLSEIERLTVP